MWASVSPPCAPALVLCPDVCFLWPAAHWPGAEGPVTVLEAARG